MSEDTLSKLKQLKELLDNGLMTEEEFKEKKKLGRVVFLVFLFFHPFFFKGSFWTA